MVQKSVEPERASRPRGRPRAFEPDVALGRAMDLFWKEGFAATSLDDLSAATGLNRPSLYGAFGDKRALYLRAYEHYRSSVRETFAPMFAEAAPLADKLRRILSAALDLYLSGEHGPRGCFTVLTTSSNAIADPEVRSIAAEALAGMDRNFERLFAQARDAGELAPEADPRRLARMTAAMLHSVSVRARGGIPRAEIEPLIEDIVAMARDAAPAKAETRKRGAPAS
jgi:TetR/AcrR family transcriptional regulator, copper-responsive repressor